MSLFQLLANIIQTHKANFSQRIYRLTANKIYFLIKDREIIIYSQQHPAAKA